MTTELYKPRDLIEKLSAGIRESELEVEKLRRELAELKELQGSTLLFARCARHHNVPQLNKSESAGAECGACVQQHSSEPFGVADLNVEFRCIRCGHLTPWVGQHCLQPKSPEAPLVRNLCRECSEIMSMA